VWRRLRRRLDVGQTSVADVGFQSSLIPATISECVMQAIVDLFSTDYGLFSIGVIVFVVFMGWWFHRFFTRKMEESEREQGIRKS
jgi:hypothetical protein